MTSAEEFAEFARVMFPRLRRTAFLLCGDWHTAEDLAQTVLTKVFVSWRRIRRQDAVHAYTHRTLVNAYLAHRRHPQAYQRVNSHGTVQIATGGFWPGGEAFTTHYQHS